MEKIFLFLCLLFYISSCQDIFVPDGSIYARKAFPIQTTDAIVSAFVCMEDWVAFVMPDFVAVACNFDIEQRLRTMLATEVNNGNAQIYNAGTTPYYDFSIDLPWITINDCNTMVAVCNETAINNYNETYCLYDVDEVYLLCTDALLIGTNLKMLHWIWTMDSISSSIILYLQENGLPEYHKMMIFGLIVITGVIGIFVGGICCGISTYIIFVLKPLRKKFKKPMEIELLDVGKKKSNLDTIDNV